MFVAANNENTVVEQESKIWFHNVILVPVTSHEHQGDIGMELIYKSQLAWLASYSIDEFSELKFDQQKQGFFSTLMAPVSQCELDISDQ